MKDWGSKKSKYYMDKVMRVLEHYNNALEINNHALAQMAFEDLKYRKWIKQHR